MSRPKGRDGLLSTRSAWGLRAETGPIMISDLPPPSQGWVVVSYKKETEEKLRTKSLSL